jgi:outer membrane protein OmpA-like peptidoglycan-associated protein
MRSLASVRNACFAAVSMKQWSTLLLLSSWCALGAAVQEAEKVQPANGPVVVEAVPVAELWTARLQASMLMLVRAARGSGVQVERAGNAIRIRALGESAFAANSSELNGVLRAVLDEWSEDVAPGSGWRATVTGYASAGGRAEANRQLAQARSNALERYLRLRGMHPDTIAARHATDSTLRGVELTLENPLP